MRIYFPIYCLLLSAGSVMISCQSKTYNKEANTIVNQFTMKEKFPNHQTAFEQVDNKVKFYNPTGSLVLVGDLKKSMYIAHQPESNYSFYLNKINDFLYFLPQKVKENYTFSTGNVGTGVGAFSTVSVINNLGLLDKKKIEYPNNDGKVSVYDVAYSYNKFAQLLQVKQDSDVILEHKYDENANIIETKTTKEQSKFTYNKEGEILQEEIINKNGSKNILNYNYNSLKLIEKKYNADETIVKEYQYDSSNQLVSVIEYNGTLDENDPNKLINHFIKKVYIYNKEQVIEEKFYEYNIRHSSIVINKKRIPIEITEQKKLAWEKLKDQSAIPFSGIEKKYSYQSNEINVVINKLDFSDSFRDVTTVAKSKVINTEIIKYKLDNLGRVVRQEVYSNQNKEPEEIKEYSY